MWNKTTGSVLVGSKADAISRSCSTFKYCQHVHNHHFKFCSCYVSLAKENCSSSLLVQQRQNPETYDQDDLFSPFMTSDYSRKSIVCGKHSYPERHVK